MKSATVRSGWLPKGGFRLDCSPYLGGAIETEILLEQLPVRKDRLDKVTAAIYNGPQFVRTYVNDPDNGVPFMTGSSMLLADLSNLPLLRKQDAHGAKLSHLRLRRGMTLISCSGTIGKMAYARPGMEGIWASQDVLKVVPDNASIPSGYLYAFLSSKFGVPLITAGTFGSIIQHLEPHHIAGLSVPRFGDALEHKIHELVEEAALGFDKYGALLREATSQVLCLAKIEDIPRHIWNSDERRLGWSQHKLRTDTLRALNYDCRVSDCFETIKSGSYSELGALCDPKFFVATIVFSRVDVDEGQGVKLVGQREAFRIWPEGRNISLSSIENLNLMVKPGATLIPSHGTFGENELFCRALYVTERTSKYVFGGDFFRCVPIGKAVHPGYLFAFLRSEVAFRMLRSISAGSKQQYQHRALMHEFPVPRLSSDAETEIGQLIESAAECFDHALFCEETARILIENAIQNS
jgi:hypothetical protein